MANNRILIIGGAGMIGRRAAHTLLHLGYDVAIYDNFACGLKAPEKIKIFNGDIRNLDYLIEVGLRFQPYYIIHLAAVHHIPTCEIQRNYALSVNVIGTENVLMMASKISVKKIVIASSGAVYKFSDKPLLEDSSELFACDNYALAKLTNENQLRLFSEDNTTLCRVARIFNSIAKDDPTAHIIPDIMAQIDLNGKKTQTIKLGNVEPKRDFTYADDTAKGIVAILLNENNKKFDIFNVCSGNQYSVRDLVENISNIIGIKILIEKDLSRIRNVDRPIQLGSPDKLTSLTGWKPEKDFKTTLKEVLGF